jgi:pyrroloquinoline quinone biosynthesis protein B
MSVETILLGTAQDAGVPQAGCYCPNCQRARDDPTQRHFVACLGLLDHAAGQSWLIDATPDFREQLHTLHQFAPDCPLAGIILTHAHIGHYAGLIHLGQEVMNTRDMPVYATLRLADFLRENEPWSQLVTLGHIQFHLLTPGVETALSADLHILPLLVPHRGRLSNTVAFVVRGSRQQLFYCPDIDSWDAWDHDLPAFVAEMDVALLDGTFFGSDELPGRDLTRIPHPFIQDTAARLAGVTAEVRLIHLNHSNPLLAAGPEQAWLKEQGLGVGVLGMRWVLG